MKRCMGISSVIKEIRYEKDKGLSYDKCSLA